MIVSKNRHIPGLVFLTSLRTVLLFLIEARASEQPLKLKDPESDLLDKEYGVRYASACEGRYCIR